MLASCMLVEQGQICTLGVRRYEPQEAMTQCEPGPGCGSLVLSFFIQGACIEHHPWVRSHSKSLIKGRGPCPVKAQ